MKFITRFCAGLVCIASSMVILASLLGNLSAYEGQQLPGLLIMAMSQALIGIMLLGLGILNLSISADEQE